MKEQMRELFEDAVRRLFQADEQTFNTAYCLGYYNSVRTKTYDGRVLPDHANVNMLWEIWQAALSAVPAQEPDYNDIQLAELIMSDCGLSTLNSESLVERIAGRIAKHIAQQPAQEPARTKLSPMPTEENPRQWYFDCDDLYIDVEHLNGEVSIFVKVRKDGSIGWKELIEKPLQEPVKQDELKAKLCTNMIRYLGATKTQAKAIVDGVFDGEHTINQADLEPVKQESKPSIDDIQSLVDASVIMLEWCVKNVKAWNFSEYDWLHRSTERVKKLLPPVEVKE